MGERGRKNALEASVVPINGLDRPKPPSTLTDEQQAIWLKVVDALPADWFRPEAIEVLVMYCRHAVTARRVADLIKRMEAEVDFDVAEYDRLLKMQEREGRALSSLATRLRITPQATRDSKSKKPSQVKRPWES
jgi:phage terminase small subunit